MMISYEVGCRHFEISYPFDLSESGTCILSNYYDNFERSLVKVEPVSLSDLDLSQLSKLDLKYINLNEISYEKDTQVIKENCTCFTCKNNYTRGYLHHLLKCKELNANILIIM